MMKRFAEIQPGRDTIHYIHETENKPELHSSFLLIDVTNNLEVQVGYTYNPETNSFYPPEPIPEPTPEPVDPQEIQLQVLINTELLLLYKEMGI